MGKPQYLIDTNSVIDYLNGKLPPDGNSFVNKIVNEIPQISVVTKIEVLGFNTQTQQAHQMLIDFIDVGIIFNLDDDVIDKTIALRKLHRIKLPDAIIAATALVYELTLITHNIKDFQNITALKTFDPHSL